MAGHESYYFPMMTFIILHKVASTFDSVEITRNCAIHLKSVAQYFPVEQFRMLYIVVLTFKYVVITLNCNV